MKTASVYGHRRSSSLAAKRLWQHITLSLLRRERDFSKFQPKHSRRRKGRFEERKSNRPRHTRTNTWTCVMLIALITFPFLFYSFLLRFCCSLFAPFLSSFDSIKIWISLSSSREKVSLPLRWDASFVLESFNLYSLLLSRSWTFLLTRSSCSSSSSDVLPMYTRASFILSPSLSRVCVYYHRRARWKEWRRAFENYIQTDDRSSRQRTLSNRNGRPFPLQRKRVFFVFSFFWSFRALWHTRPSSGETENEEGGQKTKNYLFFIFTKSLFLEGQTFVEGNAFFASF